MVVLAISITALLACNRPVSVDLSRAKELVLIGKYDEAARIYKDVIRKTHNPDELTKVLLEAASAADKAGYYDEAVEYLRRVTELKPLSNAAVAARLERGNIFLMTEQAEKALAEYWFLIRRFPNHPRKDEFFMLLAEAELAAGQNLNAFTTSRKLVDNKDQKIAERATFVASESLFMNRNFIEAIEAYRYFLERFPSSKAAPEVVCHMAMSYQARGEIGSAKAILEKWGQVYNDSSEIKNCKAGLKEFIDRIKQDAKVNKRKRG